MLFNSKDMKKSNDFYTDLYSFFILKKNINKSSMEKIFSKIRVDGTFKTTSYNRMSDVNLKLKKHIKQLFTKKIIICDIGVSSGQSTLELFNDLNKEKIKFIYGFDKQIYLKVFKIKNLIFLFSSKNDLLMVEFNKYCLRYRYFFILKKIEKILFYLINLMDIKCQKSKVLVPNLDKIDKCKFFEQDILNIKKKYYNFFNVIRVTNLLNYSYFSKAKLKIAISNIKKISKNNCIILLNRTTNKNKNIASFFMKKNGKFELLEDMNGGSEIKDLMLSCELK
tara:strand:+ start:606 stop:1445 length:840 start_codon:yes stop_codon:yes gene_type:complete